MIYEFESPKDYFEKNNPKINYDNLSEYAKDTLEVVVYKEYKRRELLRVAAATADKLDGVMQGVADLLRELSKEIK